MPTSNFISRVYLAAPFQCIAKSIDRFLLRLNCTLEDQPQSYIDQGRVLPFRDARLQTPTHFKTLISLGSSAPRLGDPIGNFMVHVLGHNGSRHKGTIAQGTIAQGTMAQPTMGNNPLKIRKT
jgi:hypothetical protein